MLAYVFWHWKAAGIESESYEDRVRSFHSSLAASRPALFIRSLSFAEAGAPWVPDTRPAFEDWYLVEGSAALDETDAVSVRIFRA